ncbi:MAG: beta-propeller fold lactonase family protein [Coriobacteriales bacterium]|nr:beta-propeller fold lactonase family protein [Coriobacteriales bacterium]
MGDKRSSRATDARRQRRMRRLTVTIIVASVVLVVLAVAGYFGVRWLVATGGLAFGPASVRVSALPKDARVTFASTTATGTVQVAELEPGEYRLRIARKGFLPVTRTVALKRGQDAALSYRLRPKPIRFTLDLRPKSAVYVIRCSNGATKTGKGRFAATLPAGTTSVRVTSKGCQPVQREFFLDEPKKLAEWLDPSGQIVHRLSIFECVPAPKGVAFTPDGSQVWVTALVTQPSIAAYDPRTGRQLGSVDLGDSGAVEVMFSRDGKRAYASQMQSASVFEIDTRTFKVVRQLKTGSSWTKIVAISPNGKRLYAANWSGDDVSEIDLKSGKLVRRIPTVDTPRGLWPTADGKRLFVAGFGENSLHGTLAVIDLKTGKSKDFFDRSGSAMRHIVADEKRGVLYTSDLGADCIWVTDMDTLKTKRWVGTDRKPNTIDISPDGKVLFVSCRGENNPASYSLPGPEWGTVLLFDTTTRKPLDAVIGGNQCTALDLSEDGTLLTFSDFLDGKMRSYEVPPYDTLKRGKGGRYLKHFDEVVKDGWAGWDGPRPGGS